MLEELPEKHTYLTLEDQIPLQINRLLNCLKKKKKVYENKKLIPIIVTPTKYCPGMLLIPTSQTVLIQNAH